MNIPQPIVTLLDKLQNAGFEAFVVGGAVRDMLLNKQPKDWDITTTAQPDKLQELFPDSFYDNAFGTVGVKATINNEPQVVHITTYRTESSYTDNRHPDNVAFSTSLEQDLSRRDFTINALAMGKDKTIHDIFNGREDLNKKIIRAVGKPDQRFQEDALRLLRAIRFSSHLDFCIEDNTLQALHRNTKLIQNIALERIGSELLQMFENKNTHTAIELLRTTGLLQNILPEVAQGIGVSQNKHHIYDVYTHNLLSLKWADQNNYSTNVKIAALLHDIAKPNTKKGEGPNSTFYGHDIVGGKMAKKICERFSWGGELTKKVCTLIAHHMFYYNTEEVSEKSVRRLVAKVGAHNMDDLVKLRICDRMGSGVPKPEPYRLRHFQYLVEKVQKDPLSVSMLKINGNDIMQELGIQPSPRVGQILVILFEQVLDEPKHNTRDNLLKQAKNLNTLSDSELADLKQKAQQREQQANKGEWDKIKKRYFV